MPEYLSSGPHTLVFSNIGDLEDANKIGVKAPGDTDKVAVGQSNSNASPVRRQRPAPRAKRRTCAVPWWLAICLAIVLFAGIVGGIMGGVMSTHHKDGNQRLVVWGRYCQI